MIKIDRKEPSIWYGEWPSEFPHAIVIHSTRSGQPDRGSIAGHDLEIQSTTNWFKSTASHVSANFVVSPREIVETVPVTRYGFHAKEHSVHSFSIEITQALTNQGYYQSQYDQVAHICNELCKDFNIRKVYLPSYSNGMNGITGHEDTEQGQRDVKSDPGLNWDWDKFIQILRGLDDMPNPNLDQRIHAAKLYNRVVLDMLKGIEPTKADLAAMKYLNIQWEGR
jgi:N-acetyl-anhydromuramyl-L-alanine amidase AmpD